MKLTPERKVYVAVLGLGLAVLAVDRAVLSPSGASASGAEPSPLPPAPAETPAAAAAAVPAAAVPAAAVPAAAVVSVPAAPRLSDRLQRAAEQAALSPGKPAADAFSAPLADGAPPEAEAPAEPEKPVAPSAAERFARAHALRSVATVGGGGVAVVDGKPVRVGERVGEFTLVEVGPTSARFEAGGERFDVVTPSAGASAPRRR